MITVKNNNNSITITDIVNKQLEKQTYYGCTIKDSENKFKNYLISKKYANNFRKDFHNEHHTKFDGVQIR